MTGPVRHQARVRLLTQDDLPALVRLEQQLFGAGAWSAAMLAEELDGPGRWYVGVEAADGAPRTGGPAGTDPGARLVGYAGLWFDGTDAQVMTVGVDRDEQGAGLGSHLMSALVGRARELGAASVLLEVRVDNVPALALYDRFGFERLGRRRGYYQPENVDAWTMRLPLRDAGAEGPS